MSHPTSRIRPHAHIHPTFFQLFNFLNISRSPAFPQRLLWLLRPTHDSSQTCFWPGVSTPVLQSNGLCWPVLAFNNVTSVKTNQTIPAPGTVSSSKACFIFWFRLHNSTPHCTAAPALPPPPEPLTWDSFRDGCGYSGREIKQGIDSGPQLSISNNFKCF